MLFRYTNYDGVEKSVETDSPAFIRRLEWLKQNGAPVEHSLLFGLNVTWKVKDANPTNEPSITETGTIVWHENGFVFGTDVYLTFISPAVALIEILKAFNKPVPSVAPAFEEKTFDNIDPNVRDWEVPGAPIGAPLPGQEGRFRSAGTGKQIGERWTGPSGRVYEFRSTGLGPLAFRYWQEI